MTEQKTWQKYIKTLWDEIQLLKVTFEVHIFFGWPLFFPGNDSTTWQKKCAYRFFG